MWYHRVRTPVLADAWLSIELHAKVFHPNLSDRAGQQMHNYVYSVAPNIIYGEPSNAFEGAAGAGAD